jgi:hypothetical protein
VRINDIAGKIEGGRNREGKMLFRLLITGHIGRHLNQLPRACSSMPGWPADRCMINAAPPQRYNAKAGEYHSIILL